MSVSVVEGRWTQLVHRWVIVNRVIINSGIPSPVRSSPINTDLLLCSKVKKLVPPMAMIEHGCEGTAVSLRGAVEHTKQGRQLVFPKQASECTAAC